MPGVSVKMSCGSLLYLNCRSLVLHLSSVSYKIDLTPYCFLVYPFVIPEQNPPLSLRVGLSRVTLGYYSTNCPIFGSFFYLRLKLVVQKFCDWISRIHKLFEDLSNKWKLKMDHTKLFEDLNWAEFSIVEDVLKAVWEFKVRALNQKTCEQFVADLRFSLQDKGKTQKAHR